jgi:hypothetical protein
MPDIATLSPNRPETLRERIDRETATREWKQRNDPGFVGAVGAAFQGGLTAETFWSLYGSGYETDPRFKMDRATVDTITKGIDQDLWPIFNGARSQEHAMFLRASALNMMDNRSKVAAAGFSGSVASMLGSLGDPTMLAAGLASGGLGAIAVKGAQVGRGAKLAIGAASGVVGNLAPAMLRQAVSPTAQPGDIALDVALGATLGGFGAVGNTLSRPARFFAAGSIGTATNLGVGAASAALTDDPERLALDYTLAESFVLFGTLASLHSTERTPANVRAMNEAVANNGRKMLPGPRGIVTPYNDPNAPKPAQPQGRLPGGSKPAGMLPQKVNTGDLPITDPAYMLPPRTVVTPYTDTSPPSFELRQRLLPEGRPPAAQAPSLRLADELGGPTPPDARPVPVERIPKRDAVRQTVRQLLETGRFDETSLAGISDSLGVAPAKVEKWAAPVVEFYQKQAAEAKLAGPLFDEPPKRATAADTAEQANQDWQDPVPFDMFATLDDAIESAKAAATPEIPAAPVVDVPTVPLTGERLAEAEAIQAKLSLDARLTQKIESLKAKRKAPKRRDVTLGTLGGNVEIGEIIDIAQEAVLRAIRAGVRTSEAVAKHIADIIASKGERAAALEGVKADIARKALRFNDASDETALKQLYIDAAEAPPPDTRTGDRMPFDLDLGSVTDSPSVMVNPVTLPNLFGTPMKVGTTRFGMSARLSSSTERLVRWVSNAVGQDFLPKADGMGVFSLSEWVSSRKKALYSKAAHAYDAVYAGYKAGAKTPLSETEFHEAAAKYVRGETLGYDAETNAHIIKAANIWKAARTSEAVAAVRHGVDGAKDYDTPSYIHRIWSGNKVQAAIETHGLEPVTEMLTEAIYKREWSGGKSTLFDTEVDAKATARNLARAVIRHGLRNPDEHAFVMGDILDRQNVDKLAETLASEGVASDVIASITHRLTHEKADAGKSKPFRNRIDMDEAYVHTLPDGSTIRVSDLLVNDIRHLHEHFTNHMLTASGLQELHFQLSRKLAGLNGTSMDEYTAPPTHGIVDDIISKLKEAAEGDRSDPVFLNELNDLKHMMNLAAGIPVRKTTNFQRILSGIRQLNLVRSLASLPSAFQQLSDASNALAIGGAAIMQNRIAGVADLYKMLANGQYSSLLMREIQAMGLAVDDVYNRPRPMIDGDTGGYTGAEDDAIGRFHQTTAKIARATLPLFRLANDSNRRVTSAILIDKFHDLAQAESGRSGSVLSEERLRDMGVTREQWRQIAAQLRKHATTEAGPLGQQTAALNLDKWEPEQAAKFHAMMNRVYNSMTTETNATSMSRWMTTPIGAILVQLRRFAFASWDNQLLRSVYFKDKQAFVNILTSAVFNVVARAGAVVFGSIGRPDQDQYLRKELDPARLATQGIARASFMSLIPMAIDSVAVDALGRQAVFSGSRPSGLTGGFILGNPTYDWANSTMKAFASLQAPAFSDYSFSQDDVRNIRKAAWVPDFFGLHRGIDALSRQLNLPARSRPMFGDQ